MALALMAIFALVLVAAVLIKRVRDRRELDRYSISPEALRALLASGHDVILFDVRQPLDLLGHSMTIPGARWIAPREVLENPSLIPKDRDAVVYCTCPGAKTSREVLHRVLGMGFLRAKFLAGGLEGWIAKGFPVEPYEKSFHLDTGGEVGSASS
jgi:rhodanese-related sulfurtransferase